MSIVKTELLRQVEYANPWNRRYSVMAVMVFFCCLLSSQLLFAANDKVQFDFDRNIGFMDEIPDDLQEAFPTCDEFLDVNWIRKLPTGNWVGRVTVSVKSGSETELLELAVLEEKGRNGYFYLFDITQSGYRGKMFDELIMSADRVYERYTSGDPDDDTFEHGLAVYKNKKRIIVRKGYIGRQSSVERGVISFKLTQARGKFCIAPPEKERWLEKGNK